MRNLLTEVSKIKSMMGLKPNINEQSFVDVYNQLLGKSQQKQEPNLMDKWSSMGQPKTPKSIQKPTGVSDKLVNFVGNIEFFVPCVYDDAKGGKCVRGEVDCCLKGRTPSGTPTIGYGTVYYPDGKKVSPKDPSITKDKAKIFLKTNLDKLANKLLNLYPNLNQNQVDALSSLCYQVGFAGCTTKSPKLSNSLKTNPNSLNGVKSNFLDFTHPDRRQKEWKIYSQGIYS
jgi:GH24 family phage-related lysozyme (muramidase)